MNWNDFLGRLGSPSLTEMRELHLMCEKGHAGLSEQEKLMNFVSFTSKNCWGPGMEYDM